MAYETKRANWRSAWSASLLTVTLLGAGAGLSPLSAQSAEDWAQMRADMDAMKADKLPAWQRAARSLLTTLGPGAPLVLVSHQVNITALTGIFPASGEGLILPLPLRPRVQPLARIPAP